MLGTLPEPIDLSFTQPDINLKDGQAKALEDLIKWVNDPHDKRHACLTGAAGVGKSFLTAIFLRECQDNFGSYAIQATSTTHKASSVLSGFMNKNDLSAIETGTIHSYLGMTMQADGSTKKLKRNPRNTPRRVKLLVVEECSMVADDLYGYILEDYGVCFDKILFIGDALQLPPVNNLGQSKTFEAELMIELTEIVRQGADNPIIMLGQHLRECILEGKGHKPLKTDIYNGIGVACVPGAKFDRLTYEAFDTPEAMQNPDLYRAVAWRNAKVKETNWEIKKTIYGGDCARFNAGDTVVTYQPVMNKFATGRNKEVQANNCEELTVEEVDFGPHPMYNDIDCDIVYMRSSKGAQITGYVVCYEDEEEYNRELQKLAKAKQWGKFWNMKEFFDIIEPAYSLTSHKSQGSSFRDVFVNQVDMSIILDMRLPSPCKKRMLTHKEKFDTYLRCLYVGITRATHRAYIKV